MMIHFRKCTRAVLQEMASAFFDQELELPDDPSLDFKWSPAEANQILFRNFGDPEAAIEELQGLTPETFYGGSQNGFVESEEETVSKPQ
jgi:hypothetical protein